MLKIKIPCVLLQASVQSFRTGRLAHNYIVTIMSDLTSSLAQVNHPPKKFQPPKSFKFPKRSFGSQGKDRRSFRGEWCDTYHWLHYDVSSDSAFCHVCMVAEFEKKFLASTKRDPAFINAGFTYWKEAVLYKI